MAAGLGVPLVRLLIAGARTERAVANAGLCRAADVGFAAA